MAEYRGLTIRIGADTSRFAAAMKATKGAVSDAQKSLRTLKQAMVIDPGNGDTAKRYIGALQSQAVAAAAKMSTLQNEMSAVGSAISQSDSSKTIQQLADETENAALAARRAHENYVNLTSSIAQVDTQLSATDTAKALDIKFDTKNNGMDDIRAFYDLLVEQGERTREQAESEIATIEQLKHAWIDARDAKADADAVDQLRRDEEEAARLAAQIKNAADEMVKMSKSDLDLGIEDDMRNVEALGRDADAAVNKFKSLDAALKLDPTNVDLARQRSEALSDATQKSKERADALRQVLQRYKDAGIDKVATDTQHLAQRTAEAKEQWSNAIQSVNTYKGLIDTAKARMAELVAEGKENTDEYNTLVQAVEQFSTAMAQAQASADQLGNEFHELNSAIDFDDKSTELQNLENSMAGLGKAGEKANEGVATSAFLILQKVGEVSKQVLEEVTQSTYNLQDAYTNMRKTVDTTEEGYQTLYDEAVQLSLTQPVSADQILNVEALGGQLGFAADELSEFQRVANGLDISTNMNWQDAATNMAQFFNIMSLEHGDVSNYGSAIVDLGNNFATTEEAISDMAMRIAGAGATLNLSAADVLGLSTALTSMGLTAEAGGSSISQIMIKVDKAVAEGTAGIDEWANKVGMGRNEFIDFVRSLDDDALSDYAKQFGMTSKAFLGETLDQVDALNVWAETAGKTSEEFTQIWTEKPIEALRLLFAGMEKAGDEGTNLNLLLEDLGITTIRQSDVARRLANNSSMVTDAVAAANKAWEENVALDTEVSRRNESLSGRMDVLGNTIQAMSTELGEGLLPIVNLGVGVLSSLVTVLDSMPDGAKTATLAVMGITSALATAIPVYNFTKEQFGKFAADFTKDVIGPLSAYVSASGGIGAAFKGFAGGIGASLKGLGASIVEIGAAGGPAIAAVGALAAVVGGIYLKNYLDATKATRDYVNALSDSGSWMQTTVDWTGYYASQMEETGYRVHEVKDRTEELTEQLTAHNQAMSDIEEGARTSAEELQRYKDIIIALGGQETLTTEENSMLKWAIDGLNESLGLNIQYEDVIKGSYEDEEGAVHNLVEELDKLIEARQNESRLAADQSLYTEAIENQSKLERQQRDAQQAFEDYMQIRRDSFSQDAKWANASQEELDAYILTIDEQARTLEENVHRTGLAVDRGAEDVSAALSLMANHQALSDLGYDIEEVVEQMQIAGLTSGDLANISSADFARMAESCGGNVADLVQALLDYGNTQPDAPELTVDNQNALEGTEQVNVAVASLPNGKTVYITADTSGLYSALSYASSAISSFTSSASTIINGKFGSGNAAGGIRFHAYGGIVDRPSWLGTRDIVGEAGAEAIIPLTNRKYVSPFADTVADELLQKMGTQGGDNITIQLNYEAGTDANQMVRELARGIQMHKATKGRW